MATYCRDRTNRVDCDYQHKGKNGPEWWGKVAVIRHALGKKGSRVSRKSHATRLLLPLTNREGRATVKGAPPSRKGRQAPSPTGPVYVRRPLGWPFQRLA
jgi:hypothetical protein